MSKQLRILFPVLCGLAMQALYVLPSAAQSEIKEKPPLYTYVAGWQIPRARWGEMNQANANDKKILDKALADGNIIGYGDDEFVVHDLDGYTHDNWWSSTSMAGLLKVLEQFSASSATASPVLESATKYSDSIFVSRYYNWHSGSYKNGYIHESAYKLKADAPSDSVELLSKEFIAPLLEKLIADGTLVEYEIDTMAIHSDAPGGFWIIYIAANADGLDKTSSALEAALKAQPLAGPAFGSITDSSAHRDSLLQGEGIYK